MAEATRKDLYPDLWKSLKHPLVVGFAIAFVLGVGNAMINNFVSLPSPDWNWLRDWERTRWLPPGWVPDHRFTCIGIYEKTTGLSRVICE